MVRLTLWNTIDTGFVILRERQLRGSLRLNLDQASNILDHKTRNGHHELASVLSQRGYLGPLYDRCISLCFSTFGHDYVDLSSGHLIAFSAAERKPQSSTTMADRMHRSMQGTVLISTSYLFSSCLYAATGI
jgi:hypothetical protein